MSNQVHVQKFETERKRKSTAVTVFFHILALGALCIPFVNYTPSENVESPIAESNITVFDFTQKTQLDGESSPRKQVMRGDKTLTPPPPPEYNPTPQTAPPDQASSKPDAPAKVLTSTTSEAPAMAPKVPVTTDAPKNPPVLNAPESAEPEIDPRSLYHGVKGGKGDKPSNSTDTNGGSGGFDDKNQKGTTTGNDLGGNGTDGIRGRRALRRPNMKEKVQKEGTIKVEICVNQSGKVTDVNTRVKGSTSNDPDLMSKAEKYAWQYEYEANSAAPEKQCGYVTFVFKVK